ncbi:hypothetical protein CSKR_114348 [Clonorchis sinensis]|uniref:Uncharacterized protein n=1 Tax=Clonorchis sinensis TaxID=79923 RepID=A0A419PUG2_CLOSI|nr:hypothetical protein CSKR_114348 [Clonorchis sinensis]
MDREGSITVPIDIGILVARRRHLLSSHTYRRGQYDFIPRPSRITTALSERACCSFSDCLPFVFLIWLCPEERSSSQFRPCDHYNAQTRLFCQEREFTDRKVRGSNPTSASRLPLSRFGQPDSIPAPVLPLGGMAARRRKGVTAERLFFFIIFHHSRSTKDRISCLPLTRMFRFSNSQQSGVLTEAQLNVGESPVYDDRLKLSVLHQAASCFSWYDIRDVVIRNTLLIGLLKTLRQPS